jgi:hypothetical protein
MTASISKNNRAIIAGYKISEEKISHLNGFFINQEKLK